MKKTLTVITLLIIILSCDAIDELTKFNIEFNTTFSIPPSTLIDVPLDIITPETTTNSQTEFENNDTRSDLVESIKLRELRLDLVTPTSGNFDFLNEIEIYISAEGLSELLIASKFDIQEDGLRTIVLDVENIELKEYIKKDSYQLRTRARTDKTINEEHEINVFTNFRVDAEILGL